MVATKDWQKYPMCDVKVIDLETGNVTNWSVKGGYFPYLETASIMPSWAYSKNKNTFYMSSGNYNVIYEFKPGNTDLKKIDKGGGKIFDISEDGNYIYLAGGIKQKSTIIKYDISKNKAEEIISGSIGSNGEISRFSGATTSSNTAGYNVVNYTLESDNKTISKIQSASFVGVFDGNEIKTVRMLPVEKIDNKINMNDIMINKKGNSFIYTVQYFDYNSKADTIKFYKTKTYLYKIQK